MTDEAADRDWGGKRIQGMLLATDYRIDRDRIESCGVEHHRTPKPCEMKRCSVSHIEM